MRFAEVSDKFGAIYHHRLIELPKPMFVFLYLEGGFSADVIKALNEFFQTLANLFGAERLFWFLVILLIASFIWKIWAEKRKDRDTNLALKEKDRTIQRLAAENREHRILIFKKIHGFSDDEIEKFILKNSPENADDARTLLESGMQSIRRVFASNEKSEEDRSEE